MDARTLARRTAVVRACYGAILTVATKPMLRAMLPGEEPSGSFVLFARSLGIRNLVFGAAALRAGSDARRWTAAWLVSDVLDSAAGFLGAGLVGRRGARVAALVPVPFIVAGIATLRGLSVRPR